ncbi:ADP-ribosylation factor GTPase-activating protein AGD4-like isoform X3 [Gossypium australe]|uniref:ADP-ribosylation factor GTPase-activating protein AGD4-like isoform X3 n=3 Tax=Gossypium TaxID=3633 RepID=A0A5B6UD16_9ROSI|nr:ADP-ribosylation factor GTPase-activating protein AGD4-like isoform X3 [Gossypium australe]
MANFIKLEDSPMFQNQISFLENTTNELKDRCQTLYKGSKKFMTALGEAFNGDNSFADSLEAFGGGQDDPISVSIGGPIVSKFINAFRELANYKEMLLSQVEHLLVDRLMHFMTVDLQDVKAREKFVSLKKNTRGDIVVELEEDLQNSKSSFERRRFDLATALMNIEAKKKYEFLESISAIMDAHLRYFKLGYDLLSQLEPFIHQVLTYAQQSKELANVEQDKLEKRIQEFRTQAEIDTLRVSKNIEPSTNAGSIQVVGMNLDKSVEPLMLSSIEGEVQTIKQGYLLKRSSSRGDWKRRFFVLDSRGSLYYYRNKESPMESNYKLQTGTEESVDKERYQSLVGRLIYLSHIGPNIAYYISLEVYILVLHLVRGNLVTGRSKKQSVIARSSAGAENRAMAQGVCQLLWLQKLPDKLKLLEEQNYPCTVITKMPSVLLKIRLNMIEQNTLRLIDTLSKKRVITINILVQLETVVVYLLNSVQGIVGTLGSRTVDLRASTIKLDTEDTDLRLCFRILTPLKTYTLQAENGVDRMDWVNKITAVIVSLLNSHIQQQHVEIPRPPNVTSPNSHGTSEIEQTGYRAEPISSVLRKIPGNDVCAECSAVEPDWASLNLGILLCIECSGVHRNLGVHISKVRSLTLDVKVWEPSIVELFCTLGNAYCNSIWEGSLLKNESVNEPKATSTSVPKPCAKDVISLKEKYIHAKYVDKLLIIKDALQPGDPPNLTNIWQAVKNDNIQEVYRLLAISETNIVNTTFDDVVSIELYHHVVDAQDSSLESQKEEKEQHDPLDCQRIKDSNDPGNCLQGCSLLHLACQGGNCVMLELLLQFGADINMRDFHGRTPLHHCVALGNNSLAKHLLRRGAKSSITDEGGLSALERAMEKGAIKDEELFILLNES